jgi:hypothetical protein
VDFEGMGYACFLQQSIIIWVPSAFLSFGKIWGNRKKKRKGSASLLLLGENGTKPSEEICLEIAIV